MSEVQVTTYRAEQWYSNELLQRLLLQALSFPFYFPTLYPKKICCLVIQLCPSLLQPHGLYPPCSSVHEIFQARIREWVTISSSRGSFQRKDQICISCVAGRFFITEPPRKPKVLVYLIHLTSVYIFV